MPGPDGVDRELGRVMVDAQADPAVVIERIVDPKGATLPRVLSAKSCTLTASGEPFGRSSLPPFLKGPINSFFLVSTEITGWPASRKAQARALMWANWLSRSGWRAPSRVLRLVCRQ